MKAFLIFSNLGWIICSQSIWPTWDNTKICNFGTSTLIYKEEYQSSEGIDCENVCAKYGYYQMFWDESRYSLSDSFCCG